MITTQQLAISSTSNSGGRWLGTQLESSVIRQSTRIEDPHLNLVEGLKLRLPDAYDLLFSLYEKRLMRVAFKITICTEDAEDVVQNTFLQVFRNVENFRGECQFSSWITAITINQALMTLRRKKSTTVSLDAGIDSGEHHIFHQIAGNECTPEQTCLRQELAESLVGFMNKLRVKNRSVFEMRFAEELSLDEIAQRLGITVAATKSRLSRARHDIRTRAKKHAKTMPLRTIVRAEFLETDRLYARPRLAEGAENELPMDWRSLASGIAV